MDELLQQRNDGSSGTIIPIILTSDKTLLSHNAKAKAWPLFMTIGNISNKVRFVPGMHCAQLICMIPIKYGTYLMRILLMDQAWRHVALSRQPKDDGNAN